MASWRHRPIWASTDFLLTDSSRTFCGDVPIDHCVWRLLCNPRIWRVFSVFQKIDTQSFTSDKIKENFFYVSISNTFLACVCILMCRLSPPESENRFSQTWQLYLSGFSSECVRRTCLTSVDLRLKRFSHLSHLKGFSPVCVRIWRLRSQRFVKDLLQLGSSQWNRYTPFVVRSPLECEGIPVIFSFEVSMRYLNIDLENWWICLYL